MGLLDFLKGKKSTDTPKQGPSNNDLMGLARRMGAGSHNGYWAGFKLRKPQVAEAIEKVCGRDMDTVSDGDAFQIVATFTRWSANAKIPIEKLKDYFHQQMKSFLDSGGTYEMIFEKFKSEKPKEAKSFNISEDFTISNFMYEWLLEMQRKEESDSLIEQMARRLNVTDIDAFKASLKKTEDELNLAPDISKLDREENKLFALAKEGAQMFRNFDPLTLDNDPAPSLTKEGMAEALILCSTMVIDLHSHFKNELDMDVQTDRYFLLLADSIMGDTPDDEIGFINSRIAFYKKECREWSNMSPLDAILPDNPISHIYNALYVNPLSDHPEIIPQGLPTHNLIMFKSHFEKVQKAMSQGRKRIKGNTSSAEDELREVAIKTLNCVVTPAMRAKMNRDVAWLFSDQIISMVKNGEIDEQLIGVMPSNIKAQIRDLANRCTQSSLSEGEVADILEDAQNEFLKPFTK